MIWKISALKGCTITATDGQIRTVSDMLFDDASWNIRWLVVDTGTWLTGRKVLLPPSVLGHADPEGREFAVKLTTEAIKKSPEINTDLPVSRQMESYVYRHYGWSPYWGGGAYNAGLYGYGMGAIGGYPELGSRHRDDVNILEMEHRDDDPNLRSMEAVIIDAVSRLVPQRKDAAGQPSLAKAAGDANVVAGERNLERMHGVIEPPTLHVIAECLGDLHAKGLLPGNRISARQEVHARGGGIQRLLRQWHQGGAQWIKHAVQLFQRHARLIKAQHGVIGVVGISDGLGDLPLYRKDPIQNRGVGAEVIARPRVRPSGVGHAFQFRHFADELRRNPRKRVNPGLGLIQRAGRHRIPAAADLFARAGNGVAHLGPSHQIARQIGQCGHLIAARSIAARRHLGPGIPGKQVQDAKQIVDLRHAGLEVGVHWQFLVVVVSWGRRRSPAGRTRQDGRPPDAMGHNPAAAGVQYGSGRRQADSAC